MTRKQAKPGKHNRRWALYAHDVLVLGMTQAASARKRKVSPQAVGEAVRAARKAKAGRDA